MPYHRYTLQNLSPVAFVLESSIETLFIEVEWNAFERLLK